MLFPADSDLLIRAANLDDVERRSRGHAKPFALADGKVVNARVLPDHLTVCGYQVSGGVGQGLALLGQISVDEALVIAAADKAYLLRVRLLGEGQAMLVCQYTDLGTGHVGERGA